MEHEESLDSMSALASLTACGNLKLLGFRSFDWLSEASVNLEYVQLVKAEQRTSACSSLSCGCLLVIRPGTFRRQSH